MLKKLNSLIKFLNSNSLNEEAKYLVKLSRLDCGSIRREFNIADAILKNQDLREIYNAYKKNIEDKFEDLICPALSETLNNLSDNNRYIFKKLDSYYSDVERQTEILTNKINSIFEEFGVGEISGYDDIKNLIYIYEVGRGEFKKNLSHYIDKGSIIEKDYKETAIKNSEEIYDALASSFSGEKNSKAFPKSSKQKYFGYISDIVNESVLMISNKSSLIEMLNKLIGNLAFNLEPKSDDKYSGVYFPKDHNIGIPLFKHIKIVDSNKNFLNTGVFYAYKGEHDVILDEFKSYVLKEFLLPQYSEKSRISKEIEKQKKIMEESEGLKRRELVKYIDALIKTNKYFLDYKDSHFSKSKNLSSLTTYIKKTIELLGQEESDFEERLLAQIKELDNISMIELDLNEDKSGPIGSFIRYSFRNKNETLETIKISLENNLKTIDDNLIKVLDSKEAMERLEHILIHELIHAKTVNYSNTYVGTGVFSRDYREDESVSYDRSEKTKKQLETRNKLIEKDKRDRGSNDKTFSEFENIQENIQGLGDDDTTRYSDVIRLMGAASYALSKPSDFQHKFGRQGLAHLVNMVEELNHKGNYSAYIDKINREISKELSIYFEKNKPSLRSEAFDNDAYYPNENLLGFLFDYFNKNTLTKEFYKKRGIDLGRKIAAEKKIREIFDKYSKGDYNYYIACASIADWFYGMQTVKRFKEYIKTQS